MKLILVFAIISVILFSVPSPIFADTPTPTPIPTQIPQEATNALGNSLNGFFSGFDWIADGLIFNTPDVTRDTITLRDGTSLGGISQYKNIFYDIAIPIFAIILAASALLHIANDDKYQLVNFLKRLAFVAILFILAPYILSYSIQFINLLDTQIQQLQVLNLVTFLTEYVQSGDFNSLLKFSSSPLLFFSPTVLLQMLIIIISMGFLLLGFLYIVFQAVTRFVALLILTVLMPIAIPFALSEKTQNITNNYFRTWFTFLIQQPAFVLGFALITTIFGNLLKAHSSSIGTLFLYAGSLIFLGGVNVFIARIFGSGWELMTINSQSMFAAGMITGFGMSSLNKFKDGALTGKETGIRNQVGATFGRTMGFLIMDRKNYSENSGIPHHEQSSRGETFINRHGYFAHKSGQRPNITWEKPKAKKGTNEER